MPRFVAVAASETDYLSNLKLELPHIGVKSKLYIGVALAISSSLFIGLSLIIKKKGLQSVAARGGVNECEICLYLMTQSQFKAHFLVTRYTLAESSWRRGARLSFKSGVVDWHNFKFVNLSPNLGRQNIQLVHQYNKVRVIFD